MAMNSISFERKARHNLHHIRKRTLSESERINYRHCPLSRDSLSLSLYHDASMNHCLSISTIIIYLYPIIHSSLYICICIYIYHIYVYVSTNYIFICLSIYLSIILHLALQYSIYQYIYLSDSLCIQ